jgi:AcrR family transcriptional regulator
MGWDESKMAGGKQNAKLAGLNRFTNARKEDTLRRLRAAADGLFGEKGYHAVSAEDIALAAGVTRKTFYQHFANKNEIAFDLFERQSEHFARFWLEIGHRNYRDAGEIRAWLDQLLDQLASCAVSRIFIIEFSLANHVMNDQIGDMAPNLVKALGNSVPEFAFDAAEPPDEKRFAQAVLLINQIMNQLTMYGAGLLKIRRDIFVDLLTENFHNFILRDNPARQAR